MEKNKLMMVIIIAILAIMLIAVGFGFMFTINMIKSSQAPQEAQVEEVSQKYDVGASTLVSLSESIKANLLPEDDGAEHLALVSVEIALAAPVDLPKKEAKAAVKEIETLNATMTSKNIIIRNTVIKLLRKTTYSDLSRADGQDILAEDILTELQEIFGSNYIVDVFFGEFFLQ